MFFMIKTSYSFLQANFLAGQQCVDAIGEIRKFTSVTDNERARFKARKSFLSGSLSQSKIFYSAKESNRFI